MLNQTPNAVRENTSPQIKSDSDFVDFTAKIEMKEQAPKGSVYYNTGIVSSYNQETLVKKQLEDKFVIGRWNDIGNTNHFIESKINGSEKEILEIADFINRAKNIIEKKKNHDFSMAEFKLDENGIPMIILHYLSLELEGGEIAEHIEDKRPYEQSEKILGDRIWNSLPENNPIKKNITKILDFLYETTDW